MSEKFFDVTRYKLGQLQNFTLRELTGVDEMAAVHRSPDTSPMQANEQLVAESIAAFNGERVEPPCIEWTAWSSRARDFVRAAFSRVNRLTEREREAFIAACPPPAGASEWIIHVGPFTEEIAHVTIRPVSGHAEISADEKSRGKGPHWFTNTLIAEAIDSADDVPVTLERWNSWSMKTRELIKIAFHRFNSAAQEELDDFLDRAFPEDGLDAST